VQRKREEKTAPRKKEKAKKKIQNSLHPLSLWASCIRTRSETSLVLQHRLSWDYFSVLQFYIVPTQSSTILLISTG
jgi:hypothetical protein